jgi:hypothetical protein
MMIIYCNFTPKISLPSIWRTVRPAQHLAHSAPSTSGTQWTQHIWHTVHPAQHLAHSAPSTSGAQCTQHSIWHTVHPAQHLAHSVPSTSGTQCTQHIWRTVHPAHLAHSAPSTSGAQCTQHNIVAQAGSHPLSPHGLAFNHRAVHLGLVVDNMAL